MDHLLDLISLQKQRESNYFFIQKSYPYFRFFFIDTLWDHSDTEFNCIFYCPSTTRNFSWNFPNSDPSLHKINNTKININKIIIWYILEMFSSFWICSTIWTQYHYAKNWSLPNYKMENHCDNECSSNINCYYFDINWFYTIKPNLIDLKVGIWVSEKSNQSFS